MNRKKFFDDYLPTHPIKAGMQDLLKRLGNNGMNTPESEDEGEDLVRTMHFWIAPEINALLDETDKLLNTVKSARFKDPTSPSRRKKGNSPKAIRPGEPRINCTLAATPGLPINWYRREWSISRTKLQLIELKAKEEEEALPVLVRLLFRVACVHSLIMISGRTSRGSLRSQSRPLNLKW